MKNGWIKLHRKFIKWGWYHKSEMVHLYLHFLLSANHEDGEWQGVKIKKGQFITGRKKISSATGISEQTIKTCITRLKSTNEITIKSTNKYSLITVKNWKEYQSTNQQTNQQIKQQLTSNQPTTNQQLTTNKNDKNVKNDKNKVLQSNDCDINPLIELFKDINPTINFGNKTQRNALKDLIKKFGYEKTENTIKYAVSIQGSQYAPTITTPYQLKNKIGDLMVYYKKENNNKPLII